ncbi:MAG: antibiotic biosynthesis monooxygenase [Rhodospirillales bacterium]|jgi:heme-degrading monooxygenase HmoA
MLSESPNYVVVFISQRTAGDNGYGAMAERMVASVEKFNGYLGAESVRDASGLGITVSYWRSLDDIARWKADAEHQQAQRLGKTDWYQHFRLTVARVEKDVRWANI